MEIEVESLEKIIMYQSLQKFLNLDKKLILI